jgi:superfamily I DNA/RNA helicase
LPDKVEKKLVVVRSDILERIQEIARKENKTLFAIVNEILQDALTANESRATIGDLARFYQLMKVEKDSGAFIMPADLLLKLIRRSHYNEELKSEWFLAGEWYGKYLTAKFERPLEVLPSLLSTCLWHLSEVKVETRTEGKTFVNIIAPNIDQQFLELTGKYLEGVMNALGYRAVKSDIVRGVAILEFLKKL